jgi:hypothetical protein
MTTFAQSTQSHGIFGFSFPTIRIAWPTAGVVSRPTQPVEKARKSSLKRLELEQFFRDDLS